MNKLPQKVQRLDSAMVKAMHPMFLPRDECGFMMCLSGSVKLRVDSSYYELHPMDMIIFRPMAAVCFYDATSDMAAYMGRTDLRHALPIINSVINTKNLLRMLLHPTATLNQHQYQAICMEAHKYMSEYEAYESADLRDEDMVALREYLLQLRGDIFVFEIISAYFENNPASGNKIQSGDMIVEQFILALYNDKGEHRQVEYYAARSGLSLKYFSTVVRERSGISPRQWIQQVTITEAKRLLATTSMSVKEISVRLNFATASMFTKYFERYSNMLPSAYRRLANLTIDRKEKNDGCHSD